MTLRAPKTPNLTREEELHLARAWRDRRDMRARDRIMAAYRKKAVSYAKKAERPGMALDDLIQEAQTGLLAALDRFDPELGFAFSTFCHYHIISRLQIFALEHSGPVRIFNTASSKALLSSYARMRRTHEDPNTGKLSESGRELICAELNIDDGQLQRFEMAMAIPTSIDTGAGEDPNAEGGSRGTALAGDDNPEEQVLDAHALDQAQTAIRSALAALDPRDAQVIAARHLKDPADTLDVIGESLGISRERVRQLEIRGLRKIKEALSAAGIHSSTTFFS